MTSGTSIPPRTPRAPDVVATSTVPVVPGGWVVLAGVRDGDTGRVRLDVCSLGSTQAPRTGRVVTGSAVAHPDGTAPAGVLRVGAAQDGSRWLGAVTGVRTYAPATGLPEERLVCAGGA